MPTFHGPGDGRGLGLGDKIGISLIGAIGLGCLTLAIVATASRDAIQSRCVTAVTDICEEQAQTECGDSKDCTQYLGRYCRARAAEEC